MSADFNPRPEIKTAIPPNTHLVPVEYVRFLRGISADAVQSLVEAGQLRFVWNVSSGTRIPALRFWQLELVAASRVSHLTLAEAIRLMLGEHRQRWRGGELAQMLMVSLPQIVRLRRSRALVGKIEHHTFWIQRPALEKFLHARWLG